MRGFRVLIIDNDASFRRNAGRFLCGRGYEVIEVSTSAEGMGALEEHLPEFVLIDLNQRDVAGLELLKSCVEHKSRPKVICTAKALRVATAIQAVKAGAVDVLERPVDAERLYRLLEEHKPHLAPMEGAPKSDTKPVELKTPLVVDFLATEDDRMRRALDKIDEAAKQERAVTIVAERPMAEQLARRYLAASPRAGGPFVTLDQEGTGTVEDRLFGTATQPSAFTLAKGGVVFVSSLEALAASGRDRLAKLLKGLAESRAGGVEVRWPPMIIATEEEPAVDAHLEREVADHLAPIAVVVPRLHARGTDAQRLFAGAVTAIAVSAGTNGISVDPRIAQAIVERSLTGGITEMVRLATESARVDREGRLVMEFGHRRERQPLKSIGLARPTAGNWSPTLDPAGTVQSFDVYEAEIFRFALRNAGGCVSRAAELLGVGRATMYRKMRAYQIDVPPVSERTISRGRRRPVELPVTDDIAVVQ